MDKLITTFLDLNGGKSLFFSFTFILFFTACNEQSPELLLKKLNPPDKVRPEIVEVIPELIKDAGGTINKSIKITVKFNEAVLVESKGNSIPRIALTIGSSLKYATYQPSSSHSQLTFIYTIVDEEIDDNIISITSPIDTNGGGIRDRSSNKASLRFTLHPESDIMFLIFKEKIVSTLRSFALLRLGGSVVTWGDGPSGGDSSLVDLKLSSDVREIYSNDHAFAALKGDGSVVTWGKVTHGGGSDLSRLVLDSGVRKLFSTKKTFTALKEDGSVVTWGDISEDDSLDPPFNLLAHEVFSNDYAFAAIKEDGSVATWGSSSAGGSSNAVASELADGVREIFSTNKAFAALKKDGSVVTWGQQPNGGDSSAVASELADGVREIFSTDSAFAAIKGRWVCGLLGKSTKWRGLQRSSLRAC